MQPIIATWSLLFHNVPNLLCMLKVINIYACFGGSFISRNFSKLFIYSYRYTPFRIIKRNISSQLQYPLLWLKFFFNTISSRSLVIFVCVPYTLAMQCTCQKYLPTPYYLCISHIESYLYHINCFSFIQISIMNLLLSISLSWLFLRP